MTTGFRPEVSNEKTDDKIISNIHFGHKNTTTKYIVSQKITKFTQNYPMSGVITAKQKG